MRMLGSTSQVVLLGGRNLPPGAVSPAAMPAEYIRPKRITAQPLQARVHRYVVSC
jgi:hypothetical protein